LKEKPALNKESLKPVESRCSLVREEKSMSQTVLGLDISKKDFHAVLIKPRKTSSAKVFGNNQAGFEKLQAWLLKEKVSDCHVGLEATSTYGEAVAEFLHERGYRVSIITP
jgi:transposase